MKFKFNHIEKNILRSIFTDSISGVMQSEDLSKENKREALLKLKKAQNQVSYNSYVTTFNKHLISQLPEVMETKIKVMKADLEELKSQENPSEEDISNHESVIRHITELKEKFSA